MEQLEPTRRFSIWHRIVVRWRHRHVTNPALWKLRVTFDDLMMSQYWDLPTNFDELNDRHLRYYDEQSEPNNPGL